MPGLDQLLGLGPRDLPLRTQRAQDYRLDDHHDLVGIRIMCPDLRALVGIGEALEKRTENRRVDQTPVETARCNQQPDIAVIKPNGPSAVKQAAVEMRNIGEVEPAAMLNPLAQPVKIFLRPARPMPGAFQEFRKN